MYLRLALALALALALVLALATISINGTVGKNKILIEVTKIGS